MSQVACTKKAGSKDPPYAQPLVVPQFAHL
jgi:hypothetical protein